jgi:hypothetical protein
MANIFIEIKRLEEEGWLHKRLLTRTRILFVIALIMLGFVVFDVLEHGLNPFLAGGLGIFGFLLGVYVFSQISNVSWNEEEEVIKSGKMDTLGFISLGLYVLFEIGLRTFLRDYYPAAAVPLVLATICGTLLGRVIGTLAEIHRVYLAQHKG